MGKRDLYMEKAVFIIKCMLGAYILTAGLLLLLAFLLYRFGLSEKVVSICIIAVYIIVTFLAGLLAGKKEKRKKFLWGLAMGALYFGILVVVSLAVNKGVECATCGGYRGKYDDGLFPLRRQRYARRDGRQMRLDGRKVLCYTI